ncbi:MULTISPECIES: hypothetical protein [Streptomyces]|uniref:hypothetical protein n=1 Tax=Streptomyces TaxID=1883 RepID=UPI00278C1698|nr:hypothetical protein [Streptomyces hydrogenans]
MVDSMDYPALRSLLSDVVGLLGAHSHDRLNTAFADLGMPQVPREAGTKAERIDQSFAQIPDSEPISSWR